MVIIGVVEVANDPPLPPQPITGSVGSRVWLIMGATGNNWLLLLNEDDGNTKWQTPDWSSIPHKVATQINNCTNKSHYVKEIDFGPMGGWYIYGIRRDNTGGHAWWGETEAASSIKANFGGPH